MDRWQKLTQGTSTVADYIAQFEEFHMRCGVIEEETVTLSRFRAGLREEIQKELILREITTLGQAYQLAQDVDSFLRVPMVRRTDSRLLPPGARPNQSHLPQPRPLSNHPSQPGSSQTPTRTFPVPAQSTSTDKGKGILGSNPPLRNQTQCFRCQKFGHIASHCNAKTYLMTELEV